MTLLARDGAVSDQPSLTLNVADFSVSVTPASATGLPGAVANFSLGGVKIAGESTIRNVEKDAAPTTFGDTRQLPLRFQ